MKFIKFTLSDGSKFTVTEIQADRILHSNQQIIQITNAKGEWDGRTINKAHIVATDRDFEAERQHRVMDAPRLPAPKEMITPAQRKKIDEKRAAITRMVNSWRTPKSVMARASKTAATQSKRGN